MLKTKITIAVVFGMSLAFGAVQLPTKQPDPFAEFSKCCQTKNKVPRCSDARTKAQCYKACQAKCGDSDSLVGKKCRQACDRWFDQ